MRIKNFNIQRVSKTTLASPVEDCAVVMVGSFAPVHTGHLDAVDAAYTALCEQGKDIGALIFVPNSEEYISEKFAGTNYGWSYEKRINKIVEQTNRLPVPAYVDDISGSIARQEQINRHVPTTLKRRLGFSAHQLYFVVGSDQLVSMKSHLSDTANNAICVLRPGSIDGVSEQIQDDWAQQAMSENRLIITERADMVNDISSTEIRHLSLSSPQLVTDGI